MAGQERHVQWRSSPRCTPRSSPRPFRRTGTCSRTRTRRRRSEARWTSRRCHLHTPCTARTHSMTTAPETLAQGYTHARAGATPVLTQSGGVECVLAIHWQWPSKEGWRGAQALRPVQPVPVPLSPVTYQPCYAGTHQLRDGTHPAERRRTGQGQGRSAWRTICGVWLVWSRCNGQEQFLTEKLRFQ